MTCTQSGADTPLIIAARDGRIDIVRSLVDEGAPLDEVGAESGTAACWAAAHGHAHVVDLLLTAGANRHIGGGPGLWAYRSRLGVQWDVLAVTRAEPGLTALWRKGGLPAERRDNYTMTETAFENTTGQNVVLIESRRSCEKYPSERLVRDILESAWTGPVLAVYTQFTGGLSSYFEEECTCDLQVCALDDHGPDRLLPIRAARALVKGPLTQLGFAHYSLRRAVEQAGLGDPAREVREIYHYYEAPGSDGNIVELQMAFD